MKGFYVELLQSITADSAVAMPLLKGTRVYYCSRDGRSSRKGVTAKDWRGNTLIANGIVLYDVVALMDVESWQIHLRYPNGEREIYDTNSEDAYCWYRDPSFMGGIYTPLVRDVIRREEWDPHPGYYEKYSREWRKANASHSKMKKQVHAPGGFTPFVPAGYSLIEEFSMSGTCYTMIPSGELV